MIKNSTIIYVTVLIIIGILSHQLLGQIFQKEANQKTESLEIKLKTLELEPKVLQVGEEDLIYIPSYTYKNEHLQMSYELFRYDGNTLVKL